MKVGLIGLAGSGKTTVFNALTGSQITVGMGKRTEWHLGVIKVPDERVDRLAAIFKPKKVTYAEIEFVDFAGVTAERSGTAFSPQAIAQMRAVDALVFVLQGWGGADPATAAEAIETELILADMIVVEKRLSRLVKAGTKGIERDVLTRALATLEGETPLRRLELSEAEAKAIQGFQFLSGKPALLLVNVGEEDISDPSPILAGMERFGLETLALCGTLEAEIAALEPEEQHEFLEDLGLSAPARDRFIRAAYRMLNLVSFLTVGEDEVRAWTIERGLPALKAAGKIHSDIERGFIRAEVIPYETFIEIGDLKRAKELGKLSLEGKDYVVQDGDIVHFRFNV
ncbi:MAG: redox-regulated ATPase YchF [Deltaproteobacteria bacterium]|nr:MAG: redox-regulated ATPase YchF [Deltaproteobacteria bacterium]